MVKEEEILHVPGFLANGICVGIKGGSTKNDLSLIYSKVPARVAGVFTSNRFKAAPVLIDMERIKRGLCQAIIINSGVANAATGKEGIKDALEISKSLSSRLQMEDALTLVASTGVIGERVPVNKIVRGIDRLVSGLRGEGIRAAEEGIMTTDRFPKIHYRTFSAGGREVKLCGIAKGAGMIEPNMATMLSFIMTDANIEKTCLERTFRDVTGETFNAISVDGCMSTNDTAIILANGFAGNAEIDEKSVCYADFREALLDVMLPLAKDIVRDGEGATKTIIVNVSKARTQEEARKIAYAVANSNLVKTAFFGADSNWGRIISAVGSTGIEFDDAEVELYFDGICLFRDGLGVEGNEEVLAGVMQKEEIAVEVRLGTGLESSRIYTSDLGFDYVKLNAHYRS